LEKNHGIKKEVWLIYFKSHTGVSRISYEDAVEEALCFGWVDSIIKKIDDERDAQKFTPRTNIKKWSESNIRRVKKFIREGKMTGAGLAKIDKSVLKRKTRSPSRHPKQMPLPSKIKRALASHAEAWEYFSSLAPSYERLYVRWILDAEKEETREKRLREATRYLG
jgi:uncharacterized protein YdeI (YjbR/CyaY-like superfamily)